MNSLIILEVLVNLLTEEGYIEALEVIKCYVEETEYMNEQATQEIRVSR